MFILMFLSSFLTSDANAYRLACYGYDSRGWVSMKRIRGDRFKGTFVAQPHTNCYERTIVRQAPRGADDHNHLCYNHKSGEWKANGFLGC